MSCRSCLLATRRLLDRPTSSRIGARVFSQYLSLSTTATPLRYSYIRDGSVVHAKRPSISNIGRRYMTSTTKHDGTLGWTERGISTPIAERLIDLYPHIIEPTPAQKLFLLSVSAGKEVLLKDDMGRGKTLALALSALNIALKSDGSKGVRVMIIVPTPYLALQITAHLTNLSPAESEEDVNGIFTLLRPTFPTISTKEPSTPSTRLPLPNTSIIISTPKDLLSYDLNRSSLGSLRYIYLDEPDTMIGSIPSRSSTSEMVRNHTLFKHPPPIIPIMNQLLNIKPGRHSDGGNSDFSERRNEVNTIWISSTLNKDFKRLIKTRGWIKRGKDYLVDLDFTGGASDKLRELRNRLLVAVERMRSQQDMKRDDQLSKENHNQVKPDHYALVIDPKDGSISSLNPNTPSSYIPPNKNKNDSTDVGNSTTPVEKRELPIEMIESLSLIHAISSSSSNNNGRYSLVLPPEGISLGKLSEELSNLGISSLILNPDVIQLGLDPSTITNSGEGDNDIPILLASRSSITGLHLPQLQTIYLLDGMDVKGLSKQQRKSGGVKDRYAFYDLVSGRLGRLGTPGHGVENQSVINLVMDGSEDEKRLKEMFGNEDNGMVLREWDVRGMERALEDELGVEEGEEADVKHYEDENDLEGYEGEGGKEDTTERQ